MKIPEAENSIVALIDKYHEARPEELRAHMGASALGKPCDRWLWLSFRWAVQPVFPGRIKRLFRRGHAEERQIVSDLRAIGIDIRATNEQQSRVDLGCHVGGSLDGIIYSGVPEAPAKKHVAEFKTHSQKSFDKLVREGVEKSKFEHFVQMQLYMHGTKIDRALYVAVCKNDDSMYTERVRYDAAVAEKYIARGHRLATDDRMPPPISTDASWYECKICPAHEFCHQTKLTKHVNCRTCAHSTAKPDGQWRCERYESDDIPVEFQRQGCESHVLHPDLVPWQRKEGPDEWTAVYVIEGREVANGEGDWHVFSSREIVANPGACHHDDEMVNRLRAEMDGRIG